MSEQTVASHQQEPSPPSIRDRRAVTGLVWVVFGLMAVLVAVSVLYAITMIRFLADDGYFLVYGSLCSMVPFVSGLDRFIPLLFAGGWSVVLFLGIIRSPLFYRTAISASLVSIVYGLLDFVLGPFSFRVGPADFDPATVQCGRWPREITQAADLDVLRLDLLSTPIGAFSLGMIVISLAIYVYLRTSRRVTTIYRLDRA